MMRHKTLVWLGCLAGMVVMTTAPSLGLEREDYGLGRAATEEEIRAWDIDVTPDGTGLPPGEGTVAQGRVLYAGKCARCHGETGTEGPQDRLVGGRGSLATGTPLKTVGSYWPYATTLYDYLNRAMPLDAPQSLAPAELYAIVAWLLHANGIIGEQDVINAATLPLVRMPNRQGFILDPRPDIGPP